MVARSRTEIVVAADSKVTDTYGNSVDRRACKLLVVGNLVVAIEGLEIDRKSGFNVLDVVTQALRLKPNAPARDKADVVTGFLSSRLADELLALQKSDPESYRRKLGSGQMFLRIVLAGFEKAQPVVFVRSFKATPHSPQKIGVTMIEDDCLDKCPGDIATRFLGETDAIDGVPDENSNFWQGGLVSGARQLIEIEIAARSEYVGPPIDIVKIDKRGIQWVQRKSECGR